VVEDELEHRMQHEHTSAGVLMQQIKLLSIAKQVAIFFSDYGLPDAVI
jgi:hypothetical protein